MHQVGCAMMCEKMVKRFQLDIRPEIAYMVGLMHDTGKMLLCQIDPEGYKNAIEKVQTEGKSLILCEQELFGCDNCLAGYIFAKNGNLPTVLQASIAHQHDLQDMGDAANMVAILSIADHLCHVEKIGSDGDRADARIHTLSAHPAWKILRPSLPPSFSITRFSNEINKELPTIREELQGLLNERVDPNEAQTV